MAEALLGGELAAQQVADPSERVRLLCEAAGNVQVYTAIYIYTAVYIRPCIYGRTYIYIRVTGSSEEPATPPSGRFGPALSVGVLVRFRPDDPRGNN